MGLWSWTKRAASRIGSGIAAVVTAPFKAETYEAIGSGLAAAGSAVAGGASWVGGKIAGGAAALTEKQTWIDAGDAVAGFGSFVWNNRGRAAELTGQGLSNAVASAFGMVGDVVCQVPDMLDNIVYDWTSRNIYNLGLEEKDQKPQRSFVGWGICTDGLTEAVQFADKISEYIYERDANGDYVLDANGEKIILRDPETGEYVRNHNANYERVILYGTQGVGEIGTFAFAAANIAALGGGALAALRGGKIVQEAVTVGRLARLGKGFSSGFKAGYRWTSPYVGRAFIVEEKAEKAVKLTATFKKLTAAAKVAEEAGNTAKAAAQTAKATSKFNKAVTLGRDAEKIESVIKARAALGQAAGWGTTRGRFIPEVIGLEMSGGMGFFGDWKEGQLFVEGVEGGEAVIQKSSDALGGELDRLERELGLTPEGNPDGGRKQSLKEQANASFGGQAPQSFWAQMRYQAGNGGNETPSLTGTANFAYSGHTTQAMQSGWADFWQNRVNQGQTPEVLTVR